MILLVFLAGAIVVFAAGMVWTGLNVIAGGLALLAVRPMLDFALRARAEHFEEMADEAFCRWAMGEFDWFLIGSLVVTGLLLWGTMWVVRQKNEKDFVWRHFFGVSYGCMALLLLGSVWYGIGTINKLFDLTAWITGTALAGGGVLHLSFFLWLWQAKKQKKLV